MMNEPERWARLESLFEIAIDLDADERRALLDRECADDPELRRDLERMLTAEGTTGRLGAVVGEAASDLIAEPPTPDRLGRRMGAYRIVRELGRGGMGTVYLGVRDDAQFSGQVAIKVLAEGGIAGGVEDRFRTEVQVLADLNHPNIARLLDAGKSDGGDSYLVMEYVDGTPIDEYCDERIATVRERLELVQRLCDAVQHAHRNLVVHRDIKCSNVLVTRDGVPKLLDFGIAKLLDPERARDLDLHRTGDSTRMMTPSSASPEQLRGEAVTTATDVYAIGHLLYRLLTGRLPHLTSDRDAAALQNAILSQTAPRPSTTVRRKAGWPDGAPSSVSLAALRASTPDRLARELVGDIDTIVLKALRKEPERRYATPSGLADDIQRHLERRPVEARGDSFAYVTRRFLQRNRLGAAGVGAAILTIIALVAFYTTRVTSERDRAQVEARRAEEVAAFIVDLFEVATPEESLGETITAREMLDRGAERIERELQSEPEVQASLMGVIGSAYRRLGLLQPATDIYRRALEGLESRGDDPDAVLGDILHDLGEVLQAQGHSAAADSALHRALDIRTALLGPEDVQVAMTLRSLADMHVELAQLDSAAIYLDRSEAILGAAEAQDSLEIAGMLLARAHLLLRSGKYPEAIEASRAAVAAQTGALGKDHPTTLTSLNNLANLLNTNGQNAEAEEVLRRIVEVRRRVLSPQHPDLGQALTNLATSLKYQGRPEEAFPLQLEALEIYRAAHDDDHQTIAMGLNNLANIHHDLRELDAAYDLHLQSMAMVRRLFGPNHSMLADSYNNIAALQLDRGDHAGALEMYERTLELDRRLLGAEHPYIVGDLAAVGVTQNLLGNAEQAEALLRESLALARSALGASHPQVGNSLRELGIVLHSRGRCDQALPFLEEAMPVLEASFTGDPWQTASARSHLGACLGETGDIGRAETLLRSGYQRLSERNGPQNRLTREARTLLVEFLRGQGRDAEADRVENPS
jgi:serine/threonine-protein kinase